MNYVSTHGHIEQSGRESVSRLLPLHCCFSLISNTIVFPRSVGKIGHQSFTHFMQRQILFLPIFLPRNRGAGVPQCLEPIILFRDTSLYHSCSSTQKWVTSINLNLCVFSVWWVPASPYLSPYLHPSFCSSSLTSDRMSNVLQIKLLAAIFIAYNFRFDLGVVMPQVRYTDCIGRCSSLRSLTPLAFTIILLSGWRPVSRDMTAQIFFKFLFGIIRFGRLAGVPLRLPVPQWTLYTDA